MKINFLLVARFLRFLTCGCDSAPFSSCVRLKCKYLAQNFAFENETIIFALRKMKGGFG